MSLIPCTSPCVYQQEGQCRLERAASRGVCDSEMAASGCVHYVGALRGQSAPNRQEGVSD